MNWEWVAKGTFVAAGAIAGYLWGGWGQIMGILLFFVVADYVTGFIAAGIEGKLSSEVGLRGIAKKVLIFAVVAIAHQVDIITGTGAHVVRDAAIAFYIWNEALSILENIGRTGLPMPEQLKRAIEVLQGKSGEKDELHR